MDELLAKYQNISSPACPVEKLVFFKSELRPGGAIYSRLEAWPLTGTH
jgi:2'-5' RNA ligase